MGPSVDGSCLDYDSGRRLLLLRSPEEKECALHDLGFHDDPRRRFLPGESLSSSRVPQTSS